MLCAGHSLQVRMLKDRQLHPASECGPGFCHGSLSKYDAVKSCLKCPVFSSGPRPARGYSVVAFPYQAHSDCCTVWPRASSSGM